MKEKFTVSKIQWIRYAYDIAEWFARKGPGSTVKDSGAMAAYCTQAAARLLERQHLDDRRLVQDGSGSTASKVGPAWSVSGSS